jgi:hypothetical protein
MKTTKRKEGMKKIYAIRYHATLDIDAKNKEEAEARANEYLNNLSTFDFSEGTCNYYEIDSVNVDWVDQNAVQ